MIELNNSLVILHSQVLSEQFSFVLYRRKDVIYNVVVFLLSM